MLGDLSTPADVGRTGTIAVSHTSLWQLLQFHPQLDSQDRRIGHEFCITAAQFRKAPKFRCCF